MINYNRYQEKNNHMERKRIVVTGGAGYIGSTLVRQLLASGYSVCVVDVLRFGGESIAELLNDVNFEFIRSDVKDLANYEDAISKAFGVIHLAAIVGDPACAKEPELAVDTNLNSLKSIYALAERHGVKKLIFASTCSNYGKMKDPESFVDETSELSPVSLYAKTKVEAEEFLMGQPRANKCKPTCLRFATVYGISPRMRFDLTVNEFTKELAMDRELVVFGEQFWRPYCHVSDIARSIITVLESPEEKTAFDVFNVGDSGENYQKQMIVEEIGKQIPGIRVRYVERTEDPRDYRVSFEKISSSLGFHVTRTVPDGIGQVKELIQKRLLSDPDDPKYKNI